MCGDRRAEVRFIVDGATGGIVIPVEASFAKGGSEGELVLWAPDEAGCVWQASLTPRVIERPESEEAVDRWAAYHAHHAHHPGHGGSSSGRTWVRCVVTGHCGQPGVASAAAELRLCRVDFNCDAFVDFFDYDDFVTAFESGDMRADITADGFLDFFDYDAFVEGFEVGC